MSQDTLFNVSLGSAFIHARSTLARMVWWSTGLSWQKREHHKGTFVVKTKILLVMIKDSFLVAVGIVSSTQPFETAKQRCFLITVNSIFGSMIKILYVTQVRCIHYDTLRQIGFIIMRKTVFSADSRSARELLIARRKITSSKILNVQQKFKLSFLLFVNFLTQSVYTLC